MMFCLADSLEIVCYEVDVFLLSSPLERARTCFSDDVTVKTILKILLLKITKAYNIDFETGIWFLLWDELEFRKWLNINWVQT